MAYQYTECGLDYVWLQNGYVQEEDAEWGVVVGIEHQEALHKMIGYDVINAPEALNGAELRYLRVELGLSQKALGSCLGYADGQMVANWEKGVGTIPRSVDVVVRALYRERILNNDNGISANISGTLDMLKDNDQAAFHERRLELLEMDGQWSNVA